jgi:hypothetical protein
MAPHIYRFLYIPSGYDQHGQFASQFQQVPVQHQAGQGVHVPPHQPPAPHIPLFQQPQPMVPQVGAVVQAAEVAKAPGKAKKV